MVHLNRWLIVHAPEASSFEIKSKCLLENSIIVETRVLSYEIDVVWRNCGKLMEEHRVRHTK